MTDMLDIKLKRIRIQCKQGTPTYQMEVLERLFVELELVGGENVVSYFLNSDTPQVTVKWEIVPGPTLEGVAYVKEIEELLELDKVGKVIAERYNVRVTLYNKVAVLNGEKLIKSYFYKKEPSSAKYRNEHVEIIQNFRCSECEKDFQSENEMLSSVINWGWDPMCWDCARTKYFTEADYGVGPLFATKPEQPPLKPTK